MISGRSLMGKASLWYGESCGSESRRPLSAAVLAVGGKTGIGTEVLALRGIQPYNLAAAFLGIGLDRFSRSREIILDRRCGCTAPDWNKEKGEPCYFVLTNNDAVGIPAPHFLQGSEKRTPLGCTQRFTEANF